MNKKRIEKKQEVRGGPTMQTYLTPPEVAKRLRVKQNTVRNWIRTGELRAINVADRKVSRPRYRVSEADLIAFENTRLVARPPTAPRRRRTPSDVIELY